MSATLNHAPKKTDSGQPEPDIVLIRVSVSEQMLRGYRADQTLVFEKAVATAKNGVGQVFGSECTPLGSHRIRAKVGAGQPVNTVFVGRRLTGEIYQQALADAHPKRDWILSRIMWLCGNEPGINRGGQVDTQRRYVYIHGAPDSHPMGIPSSHGCIKMRNADVIALFDRVSVGTQVLIKE